MPFKQFKGFDAKYYPSRANECKFPEALSPSELSTAICIVQEFLARIKRWVDFVILLSTKIFLKCEKLEDYSKLEQRLLLVDSHSSQVPRVESELLETKQRLFWFDESRRNRESSLNSHEDQESSVNLLLNGIVARLHSNPWLPLVHTSSQKLRMPSILKLEKDYNQPIW